MSSYANTSARVALNAALKERNAFAALPFPKNDVDDMCKHIDHYEELEMKCQNLEKVVYGAEWWGLTAGQDNSTDTQRTATQK